LIMSYGPPKDLKKEWLENRVKELEEELKKQERLRKELAELRRRLGVKSIPRSKIEGREVYNPDGNLVGTVQELGVMPGSGAVNLIIKTKYGGVIEIPWLDVSAAGDILILSKSAI